MSWLLAAGGQSIGNISLSSQNAIHHNMTAALITSPLQKKKRSSEFFSSPVYSDS